MWLYIVLLAFSISIPLALSFDNRLQFYKQFKYLFPSTLIIGFFYILFDIYFTRIGVWGFNPSYYLHIKLLDLPVEEWMFFIVIPFASIFLHESLVLYFPKVKLTRRISIALSVLIIIMAFIGLLVYHNKAYTVYIFSLLILVLGFALYSKIELIQQFYLTFLVILIPFVAVNAILTGSFIHSEVVWYNNTENLGIRFLTIPIEDFGYAFSLILFNLLLMNRLKKRENNKTLKQ